MIGHKLERTTQSDQVESSGGGGLHVSGLTGGPLQGIDLHVRPGEIVGVAGITGSGRELIAKLITGQTPSDAGEVTVNGVHIPNFDPRSSIRAGMAFVPADRTSHGIIPFASVGHNLTLANVWRNWRRGRLHHRRENDEVLDWVAQLDVKTAGTAVPISVLSGGNQQKVLFGRSLRLQPSVLVLDEPTSGVDVAAKDQILRLIDRAAQGGTAVVVVSTDTDELVRVAHRIVILVDGRIIDELSGTDMTADNVERSQLLTTRTAPR
jgi:ribose transport system ATP-binding protein